MPFSLKAEHKAFLNHLYKLQPQDWFSWGLYLFWKLLLFQEWHLGDQALPVTTMSWKQIKYFLKCLSNIFLLFFSPFVSKASCKCCQACQDVTLPNLPKLDVTVENFYVKCTTAAHHRHERKKDSINEVWQIKERQIRQQ